MAPRCPICRCGCDTLNAPYLPIDDPDELVAQLAIGVAFVQNVVRPAITVAEDERNARVDVVQRRLVEVAHRLRFAGS